MLPAALRALRLGVSSYRAAALPLRQVFKGKRMSARNKLTYVGAGILATLIVQALPLAFTADADEKGAADAVRARELTIVNDDGVVVVRMFSDATGGVVQVYNDDGDLRATMDADAARVGMFTPPRLRVPRMGELDARPLDGDVGADVAARRRARQPEPTTPTQPRRADSNTDIWLLGEQTPRP